MQTHEEVVEERWGLFDEASADLVKAKRRLREGTGSEGEVLECRGRWLAFRSDLVDLGECPVSDEPGQVEPVAI